MDISQFDTAIQFSDQEILHFAFVRGKDEKFRFELFQNIKKIEEFVNRQNIRKNAVVGASHFNNKICILCCGSFSWRHRSINCRTCNFLICKSCMTTDNHCLLCYNIKELEKQRKRWTFLFPYSQNSFIASKLNVPPSEMNFASDFFTEEEMNEDNLYAWFTRNMIELKINELCDINIDESPVDKEPADTSLRELYVCLETVINEFLLKCKLSNDEKIYYDLFKIVYEQQIADICYDMQMTIQNIVQTGRRLVLNSRNVNDRKNYGNLLAISVVNKLVLNYSLHRAEPSLNVAIQTEREFCHDYENQHQSNRADMHVIESFPLDYEMDSAIGADDRSSLGSNIQNWFLKDAFRKSSFRPQPTVRSVKHFYINPPIAEKSSGMENDSLEEDDQSQSTAVQSDQIKFLLKPQDFQCESGQKATFHCRLSHVVHADVYWYINNKEVRDKGRFRLIEKADDYYFEIYDTTPSDSGEIICLIVDDIAVESETCTLRINDCDVVGEDPYFEKILENQVCPNGKSLKFQIQVGGYPEPRVTFYHDRSIIYTDERYTIENQFGLWSLEINNVLPIDSGEYIALATNRMGRSCSKANLHILQKNNEEGRYRNTFSNRRMSDDDQIVVLDLAPRRKHSSTSC